jgi:hypothetical protein
LKILMILGFGGDKFTALLPPPIPEPFAALLGPTPTIVGRMFPLFKLMATIVLLELDLACSGMLLGEKVKFQRYFF